MNILGATELYILQKRSKLRFMLDKKGMTEGLLEGGGESVFTIFICWKFTTILNHTFKGYT